MSEGQHFVCIRVVNEPNTLKRYRSLNLGVMTVLSGKRLLRVLGADYDEGIVEMIVQAEQITPPATPAEFHIKVDSWPVP